MEERRTTPEYVREKSVLPSKTNKISDILNGNKLVLGNNAASNTQGNVFLGRPWGGKFMTSICCHYAKLACQIMPGEEGQTIIYIIFIPPELSTKTPK